MTCCEPCDTAASYKRHQRARTLPCEQSLIDAAAYRERRSYAATCGCGERLTRAVFHDLEIGRVRARLCVSCTTVEPLPLGRAMPTTSIGDDKGETS